VLISHYCNSGLFHALQSIETPEQLYASPRFGASWEGFALECVCRTLGKEDGDLYFWNTHAGAELDLFWQARGQNWGVEFKYEDAPRLTRSMKTAVEDLKLKRLWVVYPGKAAYPLSEKIQVIPLADVRDTWNYK